MIRCYQWEQNILAFEDTNQNQYYLQLKGDKTIVTGASATGKTLICTILKGYIDDYNAVKKYDASNLFVANKDNLDKIIHQKEKLILIDRADLLLTKDVIEYINHDRGANRYLIFSRKPLGIELSPNYFATLETKDKLLTIHYLFDVKGWN